MWIFENKHRCLCSVEVARIDLLVLILQKYAETVVPSISLSRTHPFGTIDIPKGSTSLRSRPKFLGCDRRQIWNFSNFSHVSEFLVLPFTLTSLLCPRRSNFLSCTRAEGTSWVNSRRRRDYSKLPKDVARAFLAFLGTLHPPLRNLLSRLLCTRHLYSWRITLH